MRRGILIFLSAALLLLPSLSFSQGLEYANSMLWTGINDIKVRDNYAYCAFQNGLAIIDISQPENPIIISRTYNGEGISAAIDIEGDYAFLADRRNGLQIYDISDEYNPLLISQLSVGYPDVIEAEGNLVLMATSSESPDGGRYRVDIIDISDIESPNVIGQFATSPGCAHWAKSIKINGEHAYVADNCNGILILDISSPSTPDSTGFIQTPGFPESIFINDIYLYIAAGLDGLLIYDIIDPLNPVPAGAYVSDNYFEHIEVNNNYAYIANNGLDEGLVIINIADPGSPELVSIYPVSQLGANLVAYENGFCNAIAYGHLLDVVDVSQPSNPYSRGTLVTPRVVHDVFITGHFAYVATDKQGIQIFDITNPVFPQIIGSLLEIAGRDIFVLNEYAYVLDSFHLYIIDISTPETPVVMGNYLFSSLTNDIYVLGPYAYVCTDYDGLNIIDISNPQEPTLAGNVDPGAVSYSVKVRNNIAYIAFGSGGLKMYDISDPSSPQLLSSFGHPPRSMTGVDVSSDYAFAAEDSYKLYILDISDPYNPILVGENYDCHPRGTMLVENDRIYVVHWHAGIFTLDISDPSMPRVIGSYQSPGIAINLAEYQDYIFNADGYSLMIFREVSTGIEQGAQIPTAFSLSPNYPNPFNARTTIGYTLPQPSAAKLDIYDVLGRKVQTLYDGRQTAGEHSIIWDADGFSSGTYFYRLTAGEFEQSEKMMLVK